MQRNSAQYPGWKSVDEKSQSVMDGKLFSSYIAWTEIKNG